MTTEQWFAIITLSLTAAFTGLLLWFAWDAVRAWRAEKGKAKRIEAAIDETEHFTYDWENEIHRINRDHADKMKCVHDKMIDVRKREAEIVADLRRECYEQLFDVHERKAKEEGGADE